MPRTIQGPPSLLLYFIGPMIAVKKRPTETYQDLRRTAQEAMFKLQHIIPKLGACLDRDFEDQEAQTAKN